MKASLINGKLAIEGREVLTVVFTDGSAQSFPIGSNETIEITNTGDSTEINTRGNGNQSISGKNIISGASLISVGGDFRLGD